jgi:hypothetical protein
MPRKNTVQPQPLEAFTLTDGTLIEVRDETCREIGRGLHKRDVYEEWRDKVAALVILIYLDKNGRKKVKKEDDFLNSGYKFGKWLEENTSLYPTSGDDSSVRKKLYKDILFEITVLENSISAIKNAPQS